VAANAASVPAWPPPTTITSNSFGNRIARTAYFLSKSRL
jgi:hypothetical protein